MGVAVYTCGLEREAAASINANALQPPLTRPAPHTGNSTRNVNTSGTFRSALLTHPRWGMYASDQQPSPQEWAIDPRLVELTPSSSGADLGQPSAGIRASSARPNSLARPAVDEIYHPLRTPARIALLRADPGLTSDLSPAPGAACGR
jgi:hypothetical protein